MHKKQGVNFHKSGNLCSTPFECIAFCLPPYDTLRAVRCNKAKFRVHRRHTAGGVCEQRMTALWNCIYTWVSVQYCTRITISVLFPVSLYPISYTVSQNDAFMFVICLSFTLTPYHRFLSRGHWPNSSCGCTQCSPGSSHPFPSCDQFHYHLVLHQWVWC